MQLQQLRYLIAVAECGSLRAASSKLFVSQSSISVAVKELEQETSTQIFERTSHGMILTPQGIELLGYAKQIVEQADLMVSRYGGGAPAREVRLSVSSQHYIVIVDAFSDFLAAHRRDDPSSFTLRETYTSDIVSDVQKGLSDLGIIYLSNYNDRVMKRMLDNAGAEFTSLFVATPHVFASATSPLAQRSSVRPEELAGLCRFTHEQGAESSAYYSEEPLEAIPHTRNVLFSDNGTLANVLARHDDAYTIFTGVFPEGQGIASIPLETDEVMNVGYIKRKGAPLSPLADEFLAFASERIFENIDIVEPSSVAFDYHCRRAGADADATEGGGR
ncbi:MAG: LysR family transcriptional regulator [Eggerthellaceae bacterium]|jgi:DNA-binding transcriptional LysR family regulator|nr:LysR family transcriptional regulator [Eggerthellaceae bacterium]